MKYRDEKQGMIKGGVRKISLRTFPFFVAFDKCTQ